jgi:hypothetical protein
MSNRDEFSPNTKRVVALRANQHCSFRGCPQTTSGQSEESPEAVNLTGVAAHIHGAASGPGSRRYLASMTPEERSDISNAIWLCTCHADLIDGDEVTFTADVLRAMKREHETNVAADQRNARLAGKSVPDLVAIGPDIVFVGELIGVENAVWNFHLQNFVDGDVHTLIAFIDRYDQIIAMDRYALVDSLGDGRALKSPPSITKERTGGYLVRCPVLPSADRIRAADLPSSWALSDSHDIMLKNGNWAMVSGLEALPQQVKTCLSHQKRESPLHHDFGTRFAEYYRLLSGSPWFEQFLKLEVIRQAAIPYIDPVHNRQYTPLLCVERVFGIELLAETPTNNWLPIRIDLKVKGVGRWKHDLSVCVPSVLIKRPSLDEILTGNDETF